MTSRRPFPTYITWTWVLLAVILTACTVPTTQPIPTVTTSRTPEPPSTSTITPTHTPTAIRTPPVLPDTFQTSLLNPLDQPHTYLANTCQYLQDKWSSQNSPPGTVVIPIMFHSIMKPGDSIGDNQISEKQFNELMSGLGNHGFEAITTTQLAAFLEHNTKIPLRSVILIVDDRHHADFFNKYFRPFWEADQWPVVNAWISAQRDNLDAALWKEQEALNDEGWVDYQAHGVVHNTPMWPGVSDSYIMSELQGSIDAFKTHFNKIPIAIIWPGGGFSARSVKIARQLGYQLGFTTTPRGPLMFNWIPLSDTNDLQRPSWVPEGSVNDPLLVLPRYWDTDALKHLDDIIQISQEATANAEQNKTTELEYYDIVCAQKYGPTP